MQIFFQDSLLHDIHHLDPYSQVERVTTLHEDHLFPGDPNVVMNVTMTGNKLEEGEN